MNIVRMEVIREKLGIIGTSLLQCACAKGGGARRKGSGDTALASRDSGM